MKTQEALKLALEALTIQSDRVTEIGKQREAIIAIKEALRENAMREVQRLGQEIEQEPVMWVSEDVCEGQLINGRPRKIWWECDKGVGTAFYTHPPQRTWVGLTDEEIAQGCKESWVTEQAFQSAVWWAEAKLKEKNT